MAKSIQKMRARELRSTGESIREIARLLSVSRASVSAWCADIALSNDQVDRLMKRKNDRTLPARLAGAQRQKLRRLDEIEYYTQLGRERFVRINEEQLLFIGLGIYWGEGAKTGNRLRFCNSDPQLITLMIDWLRICFNIPLADLLFRIDINESYRSDLERISRFWYKVTDADPKQFAKPSFKKVISAKIYPNRDDHYGTLSVTVRRSSRLQREILGMIIGVKEANVAV